MCLLSVNTGKVAQESYQTGDPNIRRRANQLRKLGYKVVVAKLGKSVTSCGVIDVTMVTAFPGTHNDTFDIPAPNN